MSLLPSRASLWLALCSSPFIASCAEDVAAAGPDLAPTRVAAAPAVAEAEPFEDRAAFLGHELERDEGSRRHRYTGKLQDDAPGQQEGTDPGDEVSEAAGTEQDAPAPDPEEPQGEDQPAQQDAPSGEATTQGEAPAQSGSEGAGSGEAGGQGGDAAAGRRGGGRGGEGAGRGGRGGGRWGQGGPGGEDSKPKPRPGLAIDHELITRHCVACHQESETEPGMLGRLSYMRKTPEGWENSMKRMVRVHGLVIPPEDAREIVRYLANDHGLAREEARAAMGETERRVHGSEEDFDQDLQDTCSKCHTLGRVLSERRDAKEWQLLKATHLAFFPLADFQAFRGRRRGGQDIDWENMSEAEREEAFANMNRRQSGDRADKVLGELGKQQGLFTPEWERWEVNRREIPLEGTWTVLGHEIGRGDVVGEVVITRTGTDTYTTTWELATGGAAPVVRTGEAFLYGGHSWRGKSSTHAPGEAPELKEVLLLEEDWDHMVGRLYHGDYNELGVDVRLYKRDDMTRVFDVEQPALQANSTGNQVVVHGTGFPRDTQAADWYLGEGLTVTAVDRTERHQVALTVDVSAEAPLGRREVTFRNRRGPEALLVYDAIDYIRVEPGEGLARVGGVMRGKQHERFEAVAMSRGPDDKPNTDDDVRVMVVPATWRLEEFPVRQGDDDVRFVGAIDADSGVFTPAVDGPNPERRWESNNIGDVYVRATATVSTPVRPPKGDDDEEQGPPTGLEDRVFDARGHLIVTVPIYVRWDRWAWDSAGADGGGDAPGREPGSDGGGDR